MCGIIGIISNNNSPEQLKLNNTMARLLLLGNQSRGSDSTGIATYNPGSKIQTFKQKGGANQFVHRMGNRSGQAIIGHTRWATMGAVTDRNAHPFYYRGLSIVHNGVISNHAEIAKHYNLKYNVDSEVLAPIVQNEDWNMLAEVTGSFNFLAIDSVKNRVYMNRHSNSLYFFQTDTMICFSSLEDPLFMAGNIMEPVDIKEYKDDTLQYLDLNDMSYHDIEVSYKKTYTFSNNANSENFNRSERYDRGYDDDGIPYNSRSGIWPRAGDTSQLNNMLDGTRPESTEDSEDGKDSQGNMGYPKDMFCDNCGLSIYDDEILDSIAAGLESVLCETCLEDYILHDGSLDSSSGEISKAETVINDIVVIEDKPEIIYPEKPSVKINIEHKLS